MQQYNQIGSDILERGRKRSDRTGTGTISLFGVEARYDLSKGFPLVSGRKLHLKSIIEELLWMLSGSTNNNDLRAKGVTIWDEWALTEEHTSDPERIGELGPIYSKAWRFWQDVRFVARDDVKLISTLMEEGYSYFDEFYRSEDEKTYEIMVKHVDQISAVIKSLTINPFSRRHIVSAWNVADLPNEAKSPQQNVLDGKMALPPCHMLFQFYAEELTYGERWTIAGTNGWLDPTDSFLGDDWDFVVSKYPKAIQTPKFRLSCKMTQRSMDEVLGAPYNVAAYSLLTMMIAQCVNMVPGEFIHSIGDAHIYLNHVEKFREQLTRPLKPLPTMKINPNKKDIFSFTYDDFTLEGYDPHPGIKYDISV